MEQHQQRGHRPSLAAPDLAHHLVLDLAPLVAAGASPAGVAQKCEGPGCNPEAHAENQTDKLDFAAETEPPTCPGTCVDQRKRGRSKAKTSMQLIDACHEILAEIQPASVRAVCYRLFTMGLIPNMSKGSTNKVGTQLVYAREKGLVPWPWIVDETREAERVIAWSNPDEIVQAAVNGYRRDYWQDQPNRVEVWSEKGTVRGTLAPVLRDLGITFRVQHGFASATAINAACEESNGCDKPMIVLYVGDFDPSGMYMSEVDLPRRIERYGGDVAVERVALLRHDLDGLPHFDAETKMGDTRHKWFVENYGSRCWELDAMSPVLLRERVRESIASYIDVERWNHAVSIERAEVESMRAFHAAWTSRIPGAAGRGGAA